MSTMILSPKRKEDVVDEVDIPAVFQVVIVIVKKTNTCRFTIFLRAKALKSRCLGKDGSML